VKLEEAVIAIQLSKPIKYSLEELYQAVVNMCSHKMDAQLYAKLKELTEQHVKRNIKLKELTGGSMDKLVSCCLRSTFKGLLVNFYCLLDFAGKDQPLVALVLPTNDHDSQHILVYGSNLCAAKFDRSLDLGHGAGPFSHPFCSKQRCPKANRRRFTNAY